MDALVHWRIATLTMRKDKLPQPSAPPAGTDDQSSIKESLTKANGAAVRESVIPQIEQPDEVENPPEPPITKSSSSSWVQWWRSSSRNQSNGSVITVRHLAWILLEIYSFGPHKRETNLHLHYHFPLLRDQN